MLVCSMFPLFMLYHTQLDYFVYRYIIAAMVECWEHQLLRPQCHPQGM